MDEHYYRCADQFVRMSPDHYEKYPRNNGDLEIFVGEWAAHEDPNIVPWSREARTQPPTPSMKAALGDAAFMFSQNVGDEILTTTPLPDTAPVQCAVTRNRKTGQIFVKLVNPTPTQASVTIDLKGVAVLAPTATARSRWLRTRTRPTR